MEALSLHSGDVTIAEPVLYDGISNMSHGFVTSFQLAKSWRRGRLTQLPLTKLMPRSTSDLTSHNATSSDSRFPVCSSGHATAHVLCGRPHRAFKFQCASSLARRPSPVGRLVQCGVHHRRTIPVHNPTHFYRLRWIGLVLVFKRRLATPRGNGPTTDTAVSTAFLETAYS